MRIMTVWARVSFVLFAAAFAGTAVAQAPEGLTLKDLAARYDQWRGGPAFQALRSIDVSIPTKTSVGQVWTFEEKATADGRYRVDFGPGIPNVGLTVVFTPYTRWQTCRNCDVKFTSAQIRSEALVRSLDMPTAFVPSPSRKVALTGFEVWNNVDWAIVRVDGSDGIEAFVDPHTGRLGAVRYVADGKLITLRYMDWQYVHGVRFAYSVLSQVGSDPPATLRASTVAFNGCDNDELFMRPADVRSAVFKAGETSTGWMPTGDLSHGIWMTVELDGKPVLGLLDSGSSMSIAASDQLPAGGLKAGGTVTENGLSTKSSAVVSEGNEIRIGKLILRDTSILAQPPGDLNALWGSASGHPVVILGRDAFAGLIVDLDLPNHRIAFHEPTGHDAPKDAIELPLGTKTQIPSIPVSVEDTALAQFTLDTGDFGAMELSPAFAKALDIPGKRAFSTIAGQQVGGRDLTTVTSVEQLTIGGVALKDVPLSIPSGWLSGNDIAGNIGMRVLERFRVVLDVSHNQVWLVPTQDKIVAPFWRDRSGIVATYDGSVVRITQVYTKSPAAAAGLRAGDTISKVNGQPATADRLNAAGDSPNGSQVSITLADGSEHAFQLGDFY